LLSQSDNGFRISQPDGIGTLGTRGAGWKRRGPENSFLE
jgi:hypothetical protein